MNVLNTRLNSLGQFITKCTAAGKREQISMFHVGPESIIVTGQAEVVYWHVTQASTACINIYRA